MTPRAGAAAKIIVRLAIAVVCVVGIAAILELSFGGFSAWVGSARLDVTFLVVDATTRKPVPGAVVDLYLADFHDPPHELLTADPSGRAMRYWPHTKVCGTDGTWRDEESVSLPYQIYSASAPGYQTSPEKQLWDKTHRDRVAYQPGYASVTVVIPLAREAAP